MRSRAEGGSIVVELRDMVPELVSFSSASSIQLIVEVGVIDVQFPWVDSNDGSYGTSVKIHSRLPALQEVNSRLKITIFLMQFGLLEDVFAAFVQLVVELV